MKVNFFIIIVVVLAVAGCGKAKIQQEEVNSSGLTVSEADALLADPDNSVASPIMAENIVVNKNAGPLIEKTAQIVIPEPLAVKVVQDDVSIQKALKNAGYYEGAIDGKIGPKTKSAIREFQRKNGLVDDGKVGNKTWSVLNGYL